MPGGPTGPPVLPDQPGRPNYNSLISNGNAVMNASVISGAFAFVFVAMRLISKVFIIHRVSLDDYLSVAALVFALARVGVNIAKLNSYKIEKSLIDVSWKFAQNSSRMSITAEILYLWAIMAAKLSILALYLQIFSVNQKFRHACWFTGSIVIIYCVTGTPLEVLGCTPAVKTLAQLAAQQCISLIPLSVAIGILNITTDFLIFLLPLPLIARLQLPARRRLGLTIVFATGIFVCVASIMRTVMVIRTLRSDDSRWVLVDGAVWLSLEANIGIICGCFPALPPLLRRIIPVDAIASSFKSLFSNSNSTPGSHGKSSLRFKLGNRKSRSSSKEYLADDDRAFLQMDQGNNKRTAHIKCPFDDDAAGRGLGHKSPEDGIIETYTLEVNVQPAEKTQ